MHVGIQTALRLIYPPRCVSCGDQVDSDFGLCGSCWGETPFIGGLVCDLCGTPLPGQSDGEAVHCDDCMKTARPWDHGRAALQYQDNARRLVLALKHGDRQDIILPAARWMGNAIRPILCPDTLFVPVPLHWFRLVSRRFNQSALLAQALAQELGAECCPDLLQRKQSTKSLDGMTATQRFEQLAGAISLHPKRMHKVAGRSVMLVDDVMTSGATLAACTDALGPGLPKDVSIVTLARVAKTP